MNTSCDILWYGRGGQGAFSAAKLLGAAYAHSAASRHALAFPSFGPERRGAPVRAYTKLSSAPINDRSAVVRPDHIVCLDETLAGDLDTGSLKEGGSFICVNSQIEELCTRVLGRPIVNTALLALLVAELGWLSAEDLAYGIEQTMPARIREANCELVRHVLLCADTLLPAARIEVGHE